MNRHLLLFTFGPIQGFIAQARKTADLYAGSQILTDLAIAAIRKIPSPHQILFPSSENTESLTNRIVIQVEGTAAQTKALGQELTETVRKRWLSIAKKLVGSGAFEIQDVQNQLLHHLETYWIAVPLGADYRVAYRKLNLYLAGDKNQRQWSAALNEPPGRKCALDGIRNALFFGEGGSVARRVVASAVPIGDKSLQVNEALSAVSYVKRKFGQVNPFPSTASVALMHILEGAKIAMNGGGIKENDQLYFEENLTPRFFERLGEDPAKLPLMQAEQRSWKQKVKLANLKITPYYALLHFDGDDMGKWFSGDYLPDPTKLLKFHQRFTTVLGEFAREAAAYLNQEGTGRGRTVYAGGDDFVGFVNLHALFDVLYVMRSKFDLIVYEPLKREFGLTYPITFSAGAAIAHYKQPLGMVLDMARRMEKRAKGRPGKNAWALGIMVRSGATEELVMPWWQDGFYTPLDIEEFIKSIAGEKLSTTFISRVEALERHYGGWPDEPEFSDAARTFYFNRSVARSGSSGNSGPPGSVDLDRLVASVPNLNEQQRLLNSIEFLSRHIHYPVDVPISDE